MKAGWICAAALMAMSWCVAPGMAGTLPAQPVTVPLSMVLAQHSYNSRPFRRCMRAKYGPRYFSRVPRAHRWHMAQACI